jgi:hypothetical protein
MQPYCTQFVPIIFYSITLSANWKLKPPPKKKRKKRKKRKEKREKEESSILNLLTLRLELWSVSNADLY